MAFTASPLSLAGAAIYVLVAITTAFAAHFAASREQQTWHIRSWAALTLLFVLLIAMRLFDAEGVLRDSLREYARWHGLYGSRGSMQRPMVAVVIVIAALAGCWGFWRFGRTLRGRRNIAVGLALACGASMFALVGLRVISLHLVDSLLYGPLKLNWLGDVGLSFLVAGAAIIYVKIVSSSGQNLR
ncbi:hypothetical protein OZN62_08810 [Aurantiacibacter sp. MUD11]|uniref:hypothetical protein n=1 Tax=Aurantiacibacter sp. MUD11 TaxID=3003265 RepID=UPI0022AA3B66|nr:hypothetical protein [Aurantiacibacter sp. MUD11]WAT17040.1 hypothetical protein OZN62_08810 [Aurantiacibacter sp. MUD11]